MNLKFTSGDKIQFSSYTSTAYQFNFVTTQLFRDVSAWYHIVGAVDTTQATNTNRVKLYVNGTQVTALDTATYPSQNANLIMNGNAPYTYLGIYRPTFFYLNGYLSETIWIDGQQLDATSFGETDTDTGIWKPKAYTGTYGTNGFYLKFANSSSLGTDSSGNGNTFTVNNLTSIDQSTDTPTNNFATLNPLNMGTRITLSEGNLQQSTSASTSSSCRVASTIAVSSGKWYCEYKASSGTNGLVGIYATTENPTDGFIGSTSKSYGYYSNGTKYTNNSGSSYGASWTTNDIIGIAFDADNGTLTFYKNGTSQGTAFTSIPNDFYYFAQGDSTNTTWTGQFNFGSPMYSANSYTDGAGRGNFSYAVPSGYFALCTANLSLYG